MMASLLTQPWLKWGVIILVGLPFFTILLGEIAHKLKKRNSVFHGVTTNLRNFLLPSLFAYLLLQYVIELDSESTLLKIVVTVFWVILIHSVLKFINTLVFSEALSAETREKIPKLLVDFFRSFLVLLGAAFVFSNVWGADLGRLLTALGVGSIVLGMALQDVLGGLFAGLALLSSRPFVVGDWIKVGDSEGIVRNIDWRAVTLDTRENEHVVIANAVLAKEKFHNFCRPDPFHMEVIGFDISFDDPPSKVKDVLELTALATPGIRKDPPPCARLISYDVFSIHYKITYFIDDYGSEPNIRNDFVSRVWYANKRYGITFPNPVQEIHTFAGPKLEESTEQSAEFIADKLKSLSVLDLPHDQLVQLAKSSKINNYGKGECIVWMGEKVSSFYIITKGEVSEQIIDKEGILNTISLLSEGDFFGVSGMVRREPHSANIVAQDDTDVIAININAMRKVLQLNPQVAQCLESIVEAREKHMENAV